MRNICPCHLTRLQCCERTEELLYVCTIFRLHNFCHCITHLANRSFADCFGHFHAWKLFAKCFKHSCCNCRGRQHRPDKPNVTNTIAYPCAHFEFMGNFLRGSSLREVSHLARQLFRSEFSHQTHVARQTNSCSSTHLQVKLHGKCCKQVIRAPTAGAKGQGWVNVKCLARPAPILDPKMYHFSTSW